jgi:TatD DNase family protein
MLIDTHTHLNFKAFENDWHEVVERAIKAGVERMVVVGTDLISSKRAVEMADEHPALFAGIGIHPHHARGITRAKLQMPNLIDELRKLAGHPRVVAIGEVGLDYHVYKKSKYQTVDDKQNWERLKNLQKRLLGMQVQLAKELKKPMIIHSREAGEEVLDAIEHFSKSDGRLPEGVWHCFEGSKKYLKKVLGGGFYVSFTGNITYVKDRAAVAREAPLERLLLETDCPYMKPRIKGHPLPELETGKSEPKDVKILAEFHAKERGISLSKIVKQTAENAEKLFKFG